MPEKVTKGLQEAIQQAATKAKQVTEGNKKPVPPNDPGKLRECGFKKCSDCSFAEATVRAHGGTCVLVVCSATSPWSQMARDEVEACTGHKARPVLETSPP